MRLLARLNSFVAVLVFVALTSVVALQVLNRLVLHLPIIWSEEVARFLFFWVALLGAAQSVHRRRHFVLDVTMGRAHPTGRLAHVLFQVVPDLCVLGFLVFLFVVGLDYARTGAFRTAANSDVNMAFVYAAIPAFALLSTVYAAANLLGSFRERVPTGGGEPPVEAAE